MCALLSWIEKDGEIMFITDKEVNSSDWRKRMVGTKDGDALGHTAIHRFFDFSGGVGKIERKFWDTSRLPKELAEAITNFDDNFKTLFETCMSNTELCEIIKNAPPHFQHKAWMQLKKQKPSLDDLTYILDNYLRGQMDKRR